MIMGNLQDLRSALEIIDRREEDNEAEEIESGDLGRRQRSSNEEAKGDGRGRINL
jgi:hypothetical protein